MAGIEDVLDLNQAAQIAGVTPARLRQLIEAGQLRGKKIGNSWAILADDLNTLLGRERPPGRPDADRAARGERDRVRAPRAAQLNPPRWPRGGDSLG